MDSNFDFLPRLPRPIFVSFPFTCGAKIGRPLGNSARQFLSRRAALAVLFSMLAASTWACGSEDNASFGGTCFEGVVVDAPAVLTWASAWRYDGVDQSTVQAPAGALLCSVKAEGSVVSDATSFFSLRGEFACVENGKPLMALTKDESAIARRGFEVSWWYDGDVREWEAGLQEGMNRGQVYAHYADPCHEEGSCLGWCGASLGDRPLQINVLEAVGGSAPYPEMVTEDFRRRWSVDIDFWDAQDYQCSRTVGAHVVVEFELTHADFHLEPDAVCPM